MTSASRMGRAAVLGAALLGAVGCSHVESASIGVALPSATASAAAPGAKPIEVRTTRVLATGIDLRQPVFVQRVGDAIEVTYAMRQRDGVTLRLHPRTLQEIDEKSAYVYPRCSARDVSKHLKRDVAKLSLDTGDEVTVFTSEEVNRGFARVGDGAAVPVSPGGLAIVGPARANTNGKDVVTVFVAATQDGFALVATSLEIAVSDRSGASGRIASR